MIHSNAVQPIGNTSANGNAGSASRTRETNQNSKPVSSPRIAMVAR